MSQPPISERDARRPGIDVETLNRAEHRLVDGLGHLVEFDPVLRNGHDGFFSRKKIVSSPPASAGSRVAGVLVDFLLDALAHLLEKLLLVRLTEQPLQAP